MKHLVFFLFLSLCSISSAQNILFSDTKPNKDELDLISITIGDSKNLITFTSNFNNDLVSIFVDGKSIFSDRISTDEILGSARGIIFDRESDSLLIKLNNDKFQVKNIPNYRFIYFYNDNGNFSIEYRKSPLIFE